MPLHRGASISNGFSTMWQIKYSTNLLYQSHPGFEGSGAIAMDLFYLGNIDKLLDGSGGEERGFLSIRNTYSHVQEFMISVSILHS